MKKVTLPVPALTWGGLQGVISALDRPLKERGFLQQVLVPEGGEIVRDKLRSLGVFAECVPLPRLRRSPLGSLKAVIQLPNAISRLRQLPFIRETDVFQAVGVHHPHAIALAALCQRPLVWQLHGEMVRGVFRSIARQVIGRYQAGVLANGQRIGRTFCGSAFGCGNHGIFYPPIDIEKFAPNAEARRRCRAEFGYSESDVVICIIGNRSWPKNHQLLVEIAAKLRKRGKLRFLVVGPEVPSYAATYASQVIEPANVLNAESEDYIRFVDAPDGVVNIMNAIDIFAMTSRAEGIPLVIGEAMAAGKPVVSSRVGSIAEVVAEGDTGFVVSVNDIESFCDRLRTLADDPELRQRMGEKAMSRAEELFSPGAAAQTHADVYRRAISDVVHQTKGTLIKC